VSDLTDVCRIESDSLGSLSLPSLALHGIHAERARGNFDLLGQGVHPALVRAYGEVKLACLLTNRDLGHHTDPALVDAMATACREMALGLLPAPEWLDALQGGAGTSTNFWVNEVIANRALVLLGHRPGQYDIISPSAHVNLHQSTNDTFPTALRIAAMRSLNDLERQIVSLQEAFQTKEAEFSDVVKVGRTELMDAVLVTLGREMGTYAEALSRDRWRVYQCLERLRIVNLGGTAVGTGISAPREYIFRVVDTLRRVTGLPLARAENLMDATSNVDVFAEVSGILRTLAVTIHKLSGDLRLLGSGPDAGFGEIELPARQAGSTIMPGKVNPVIAEAAQQASLLVFGLDGVVAATCAAGNLELNPFLPLVAHALLQEIDLLTRACRALSERCIRGIEANLERCAATVDGAVATATALLGTLGYDQASRVVAEARQRRASIRQVARDLGSVSDQQFDQLTSAEAVCALGTPPNQGATR